MYIHTPEAVVLSAVPQMASVSGTLFRLCLGCLGDAFQASVAVKSALRLPPSFWNCLCLAILLICLNLVRSSPCGTGEIRKALPILLSYPKVQGAISEACVFSVRIT